MVIRISRGTLKIHLLSKTWRAIRSKTSILVVSVVHWVVPLSEVVPAWVVVGFSSPVRFSGPASHWIMTEGPNF